MSAPSTHDADEEAGAYTGGEVREFSGALGTLFFAVCIGISLLHVTANLFGPALSQWLTGMKFIAVHFAGFAFLCALRYPLFAARSPGVARMVLWFDLAFGTAAALATIGILASENAIYARGVHLAPHEWAMALFVIFSALELTRRATGWIIPAIALIALTYVSWWGGMISGVFRFAGLSFETVIFRSIFSDEGMFGIIGNISASFVFLFILFGAFLVRSGAGEFIIDLARALAGRFVGGPGFVAVMSSGLTGTISGSAVANTVSTGVITIPLMKRSGFPPRFAAGVEAASSTGGQLMPPIMGAGAFVMSSYTQIPYLDIVAVSFLPAVVYFLSVGFFVRIEAKRQNLSVLDHDTPKALDVLKRGGPAFLFPIGLLIGLLIYGFTPTYAACWAILAVIAASWLTPNRMGPRAVLEALALGARNMIMTGVLLITVGLIVNVIAMTGIGNTFSLMVAEWAGGNLLVAIVLIALASLVLGMGLPVTAAYIVLATLSAPALHALIQNNALVDAMVAGSVPEAARMAFMLVNPDAVAQLAEPMSLEAARALVAETPPEILSITYDQVLDPAVVTAALLSAHLIIFWLSQDSNVTPPVCLTAFAAAAIAKTPPMATGLMSWKLAKGMYLVPVLFAYTNFVGGTLPEVLAIFVAATLGVYALGAAIEGHMEAPLNWPLRILTAAAGVALIWPNTPLLEIAGGIVVLGILFWSIRTDRRSRIAV
ncbi:TRAP transporter permease [Tepidamorphus sp. 3E244]|uniref:TRAP transporter permease n=1 Tax=Tepidamorphus sp. 3E244 TaxID=3385498 RepID=UPI0038FC936F